MYLVFFSITNLKRGLALVLTAWSGWRGGRIVISMKRSQMVTNKDGPVKSWKILNHGRPSVKDTCTESSLRLWIVTWVKAIAKLSQLLLSVLWRKTQLLIYWKCGRKRAKVSLFWTVCDWSSRALLWNVYSPALKVKNILLQRNGEKQKEVSRSVRGG